MVSRIQFPRPCSNAGLGIVLLDCEYVFWFLTTIDAQALARTWEEVVKKLTSDCVLFCMRKNMKKVHVWSLSLRMDKTIKCDKGISWMPWHVEAMKDVTLCDKLRGAGSKL